MSRRDRLLGDAFALMTPFDAIVLGIVEGITEFLPISSTGHLIVSVRALGIPSTPFVKSFEISIQVGAALALVPTAVRSFWRRPGLIAPLFAAFLPTAALGVLAHGFIREYFLGSSVVVAVALIVGGVVLIVFERRAVAQPSVSLDELTLSQAALVGIGQSVAMIPGVSRAGATILSGMWMGLDRRSAVLLSFLLALPTLVAATALDLWKTSIVFSQSEWQLLLLGSVTAWAAALVAMRWLLRFVETHHFTSFGWYRILFGTTILVLLFSGLL